MGTLPTYFQKLKLKLSAAKIVSDSFHLNSREASRELNVTVNCRTIPLRVKPTYFGVKLDKTP